MSALKDRITADMKTAMREKDKERLATIRMLTAAIKQREVDERIELTDDDVVAIVEKLVKQRREAEAQYRAGDRPELADQEAAEAALLTPYLPAQLDEAEIDALIEQAMADTGAESMRDMGKVMGQLKPKVAGRTDMSALSAKIKARLAGLFSLRRNTTGHPRSSAADTTRCRRPHAPTWPQAPVDPKPGFRRRSGKPRARPRREGGRAGR